MKYFSRLFCYLLVLALLLSCQEAKRAPLLTPGLLESRLNDFQSFSLTQNRIAIEEAEKLELAISTFLSMNTQEHKDTLLKTWQSTHKAYLASQFGLFLPSEERTEILFSLETWPLQPGFIDSLPEYPDSGVVNDITMSIDLPSLRQQHGVTDREELCLGFHTLEYLVYERSLEDFSPNDKSEFVERRRLLLKLLGEEVLNNLRQSTKLISNQFSAEQNASDIFKFYHLLLSTSDYLQVTQRASNLLFDENSGHGSYSQSATSALTAELIALERYFLKEVNLTPLLMEIDSKSAANFKKTLEDAIALLEDPEAGEIEFAKLPLMISALIHQLESFETTMSRNLE